MNKEELARQYTDKKVEERKEYPLYDMRKRKKLTSFDGYAIEQAYEDGFDKAVKMACKWLKNHLWEYDHGSVIQIDAKDITDDLKRDMED